MTLDELEAIEAARRPLPLDLGEEWEVVTDDDTISEVVFTPRPPLQEYDIAYGMEEVALAQGLCPQCGEAVALNRELTLAADLDQDTLFYDCTHTPNHKYMVVNASDPR